MVYSSSATTFKTEETDGITFEPLEPKKVRTIKMGSVDVQIDASGLSLDGQSHKVFFQTLERDAQNGLYPMICFNSRGWANSRNYLFSVILSAGSLTLACASSSKDLSVDGQVVNSSTPPLTLKAGQEYTIQFTKLTANNTLKIKY